MTTEYRVTAWCQWTGTKEIPKNKQRYRRRSFGRSVGCWFCCNVYFLAELILRSIKDHFQVKSLTLQFKSTSNFKVQIQNVCLQQRAKVYKKIFHIFLYMTAHTRLQFEASISGIHINIYIKTIIQILLLHEGMITFIFILSIKNMWRVCVWYIVIILWSSVTHYAFANFLLLLHLVQNCLGILSHYFLFCLYNCIWFCV